MSEELKPALSAEKWEQGRFIGLAIGNVELREDGRLISYTGDEYYGDTDEIAPEHRHALAALCLYGQPFGFTRDDVGALRDAIGMGHDALCGFAEDEPARQYRVALESLASRIAALLPPEEP